MVRFLGPETAEILQFLDPEIEKMDKKNSGSRNRRNGVISGSRNRRKGRQILYDFLTYDPPNFRQAPPLYEYLSVKSMSLSLFLSVKLVHLCIPPVCFFITNPVHLCIPPGTQDNGWGKGAHIPQPCCDFLQTFKSPEPFCLPPYDKHRNLEDLVCRY